MPTRVAVVGLRGALAALGPWRLVRDERAASTNVGREGGGGGEMARACLRARSHTCLVCG